MMSSNILRQIFLGKPFPASPQINRILVIRRNGIGDMVCALPLLRALKKAYPSAHLTVLADPQNAAVARCCEAVDETLVFPLRKRLFKGRTWQGWRTSRELRKRHFDLAIGVSGSFSNLLGQIIYGTGAPLRLGTLQPDRVQYPPYYTHFRVRPHGCRTHQIVTGVELLKSFDIDCDPNNIHLELPKAEMVWAKDWTSSQIDTTKPTVWLHLSNRRDESRWKPDNFKELANKILNQTDANVVLAKEKNDPFAKLDLFDSLPKQRVVWFENESFLKFAAALSQAKIVVCGDGGVMHLAAALDTKVVALFSATEPDIWRPWGTDPVVLRRGPNVDLIPVEEVFEAVAKNCSTKSLQ